MKTGYVHTNILRYKTDDYVIIFPKYISEDDYFMSSQRSNMLSGVYWLYTQNKNKQHKYGKFWQKDCVAKALENYSHIHYIFDLYFQTLRRLKV